MAHERMFHHTHADKLDDPERRAWLPPEEVVRRLELRPGLRVADIGAGSGYLTAPIAEAVGPTGRVAALDLQPEMLERLRHRLAPGAPVDRVQADASATTLPASSQDLALIANVWHELDGRTAALAEMARIVRGAGRLAILDWRTDVAQPPGPPLERRSGVNPSWLRGLQRSMVFRTMLFMLLGAAGGLAYQRVVGCRTGICPITSSPPTSRRSTARSWGSCSRAACADRTG